MTGFPLNPFAGSPSAFVVRSRVVWEGGGIRREQLSCRAEGVEWGPSRQTAASGRYQVCVGGFVSDVRSHDVTALLLEWRGGDSGTIEKLLPLVHGELRRIAT